MWSAAPKTATEEKFSLANLRALNAVLVQHAVVTETNKALLVETFRALAELLTWGDQHEPALFDFFVETRMLAHFVRILVLCAPAPASGTAEEHLTEVAVQVLQSLSILVQNTRRETSTYYLFSNNYINDLMGLKCFDFSLNEEVLAWYICFLKAISQALNPATIQFFVADSEAPSAPQAIPAAFPLFSQVIRYVQHGDSMVRAAARAATLNIFRVDDTAARAFILKGPEAHYFAALAASLMELTANLSPLFTSGPWPAVASTMARLGDLLCYCTDMLDLGIEGVSEALTGALWSGLAIPLLAVAAGETPDGPTAPITRTAALFVLSRLVHSIAHQPLVASLAQHALQDGSAERTAIVSFMLERGPTSPESVAALMFLATLTLSNAVEKDVLEAVGLLVCRRRNSPVAGSTSKPASPGAPASCVPGEQTASSVRRLRDELVTSLQAFIAAGAADDFVSHASIQATSHAAWLLCELAPTTLVPSAGAEAAGPPCLPITVVRAAYATLATHVHGPWTDALAPFLRSQHAAMGSALLGPPAIDDEQTALLLLAHSLSRPQTTADPAPPARAATASSADALLVAVRRFLVVSAAAAQLSGAGSVAPACPSALSVCCSEEPREGFPAPRNLPDGIPCRVAFERGKECRVLLTVATAPLQCDPLASTALTLLVDAPAAALRSASAEALSIDAVPWETCGLGLVHAVAPVAGVEPFIDASHPKWLHLRVRPAAATLLACAALPTTPGSMPTAPGWHLPPPFASQRRLQDGHWTLAFASEEACVAAADMLRSSCAALQHACASAIGSPS